ncbi:MAG TPA: site-2 protease family protein [Isosphaeraceae bacterium]|nr:site-2 protease family protein [Isosphaeraceae bacterium]
MNWSWRIGRIAGIDVYVHFTFVLLLGWVALSHYMANGDLAEAMGGLIFILALFGIVVLHELGHALTARHYGIRTRDITLLPIGGVARLERMPEEPRQELVVALAGPAVNVALALGIYLILALGQGLAPVGDVLQVGGGLLSQLFWVNVSLAVFNLLPAFPMDGGRVLRAFLAMRTDYVRATQTAASIGQGMALLFAFLGLFSNPFLIFIALFVWLAATQEASLVQMRSALDGIPVQRAMIRYFRTLSADEPLSRAADYVTAGFHHDFPVVEDGRLVGMLTRPALATALAQFGPQGRVRDAIQRDIVTVAPAEMLQTALAKLQDCDCRTLPVVQDGRLMGLVTADSLAEVLMIQEALGEARRLGRSPAQAQGRDGAGVALRLSDDTAFDELARPKTASLGAGDAINPGAGRTPRGG